MSISFELAKQLKEAGFPQIHVELGKVGDHAYGESSICYPTLEELIKQMPMRQKYLGTLNDAHFVLRKLVSKIDEYRACYQDEDTHLPAIGFDFISEDPKEAVSNLYLAIKKAELLRDNTELTFNI